MSRLGRPRGCRNAHAPTTLPELVTGEYLSVTGPLSLAQVDHAQSCAVVRDCLKNVAETETFACGIDPELDPAQEGRLPMTHIDPIVAPPVQKVVVVNGNTEVLGMLETVLDAGRYDMVFVESGDRAYSQIKKVVPNLVILCTRIEELDGFQLLTMLKLDADTRDIPVLTYTTECEGQDFDEAISQLADEEDELLPARPALRMN
jgi:CheY-like chemotaxis protein